MLHVAAASGADVRLCALNSAGKAQKRHAAENMPVGVSWAK